MKFATKIIISCLLAMVVCTSIYLNAALYYKPEIKTEEQDTINYDLLLQLRYLKGAIASGEAEAMQKLYPEGYIFMHALTALAWHDFARQCDPSLALYEEAHTEISKSCSAITDDLAKSTFDPYLQLPYGAFYTGWSNFLLGKKLGLESMSKRNIEEVNLFKQQCESIAHALDSSVSPYLESYYKAAWPADMLMCIASLGLHDQLYTPRYTATIETWLKKVKTNLDVNGLIPHAADAVTGKPNEDARGSSQSLMLVFLYEIDPDFARQQFELYKRCFLGSCLGLPGIREYCNGTAGSGDIDSGPVIFGMGAAATLVGMRTMATYHDHSNANALECGIEAFGIPIKNDHEKKYIFGTLPIADAFIAWAHAGLPRKTNVENDVSWRNYFHIYSILIVTVAMLLLIIVWSYKKSFKKSNERSNLS
ncbi:hypothetical protein [Ohtaekwangia koreensis]|uniref:Uncharacterized protein n=1 Tax=Ohtaekwangia koreensis TaxID=688867 RepID=A0A1T5LAB9_9BACT|nr:hypothetical protein [Ohtaekwangia koreensis]SKC72893.1 hypothetical protein SAMN05660236_2827 [Ohtaekwangia koreensis]